MELKTTDLRIGNLLHSGTVVGLADNGEIKVYDGYSVFSSNSMSEQWRSEQPIELSSDILIKAGFEVKKWGEIETIEYDISDGIYLTKINENVASVVVLYAQGVEVYRYLYLHQLQNLYFSITGTELNITL